MFVRYDVRNKLDDQSQFALKPNLPRPMSTKELDFEEELDKERYLALECEEIRVEEEEGEFYNMARFEPNIRRCLLRTGLRLHLTCS